MGPSRSDPWRRLGWVAVLALAAVGILQWWLGSTPIAALAASYVALLGLLTRALPVRVAVSAALLVQQAVLLVLVLVVPLVLGGPLRPGVALALLLAPCLAVVPDLLLARPAGPSQRPEWGVVAAACTGGVVLVVTVLLAGLEDSFGSVAWSASGDARLHLLFARMVLDQGGLHGTPLSYQPEFQESLTALLLDAHGRGTMAPGQLLEHDLRALAVVSVFLVVVWTLATTATLIGFAPLRGRLAWVVVAAASLLPITGLALGVLLHDGFLTILLLVPLLLATLSVLSWLHTTDAVGTAVTVAVAASAAALPVLSFTWTPYAVVMGVAALAPWLRAVRAGEHRVLRIALMVLGAGSAAAYCLVVLANTEGFITINGGIVAPSPAIGVLVALVVLLVATAGWTTVVPRAFVPYLAGTVAVAGITAYAVLVQPEGLPWNYFPSKVAWIWVLVGFPLLLVPFAHPRPAPGKPLLVAGGAAGVVAAALALSPVTSPVSPPVLSWLQSGRAPTATIGHWDQPDVDSLRLAVRLGDERRRYVVYGVSPEDDRLTNFWLAAYDKHDGPTHRDEFISWGYRETGTLADVCELLALQPDRVVATADPAAEEQLRAQCGREVRVRMLRS